MSGGSTMFRGLATRLQNEIIELAPSTMTIKVHGDSKRNIDTWVGGSALASLSYFSQFWITQ